MVGLINLICPALLAFILASLVAWLELITSNYPRTVFFIRKYWALYVYALVYGVVGFAVMLALPLLDIKLEGPLVSNRWMQAVAVGLSTKAFLHIRLFTVGSAPIGIESIIHLFEPTLLQYIDLEEYFKVKEFLNPRVATYDVPPPPPALEAVKQRVLAGLPTSFAGAERVSFETDLNKANSIAGAMEVYLRRFGRRLFNQTLPP